MSKYQVLARKYRPQTFTEVLGQSPVVTTLKNAIKFKRLAHAYLFCGSRGTGKTTLARLFAKALNCQNPTPQGEPCNTCSSCKEITSGHSLDVLEIDGASHRGIDDIRQINDTVGYQATSGKHKVYIIDEVHMLTKEAFNALLKTLEEPPAHVIFLFATTEPHKVLPTILSRCQRFNLSRISSAHITEKLKKIALELNIEVEEEALHLLAERADGGLRDAESLFDQVIAFHEGQITPSTIADVLGIVSKETLFLLDQAGKEGRFSAAFDISHHIFSQGKDFIHFVETLTEHFRTLLLIKLSGLQSSLLQLSEKDQIRYEASAKLYTQEQCLTILEFLIEAQNQIRFQPSARIALESLLLKIMRTHQRLPIEFLVRRLTELEQAIGNPALLEENKTSTPPVQAQSQPKAQLQPQSQQTAAIPQSPPPKATPATAAQVAPPTPKHLPPLQSQQPPVKVASQSPVSSPLSSINEDPTPTPQDLGLKKPQKEKVSEVKPPEGKPMSAQEPPSAAKHPQSRYDTLLQFATVELEGILKKS